MKSKENTSDMSSERSVIESIGRKTNFFAPLVATSGVGLATIDEGLRYRAINDELASTNGFPAEEHIGKTVRQMLGAVADELEPKLKRVFGTGENLTFETSLKLPTRPKTGRWIQTYIPIKDADDKVSRICAVVVEVTEKKMLEDCLFSLMGKLLYLKANLKSKQRDLFDGRLARRREELHLLHSMKLVEECARETINVLRLIHPSTSLNSSRELHETNSVQPVESGQPEPCLRDLSRREYQVLQLLASNKNNKEVANSLGISVRTVEAHRRRIMEKLGLHSMGELIHFAIRNGIVEA